MFLLSFYTIQSYSIYSPGGVLFVATVPVAAGDLQTLNESQLQALSHLEAGLVDDVLIGGWVGNLGTGVHLWFTDLLRLHTVYTVRTLKDTVLTLQGLTIGDGHQEQESKSK